MSSRVNSGSSGWRLNSSNMHSRKMTGSTGDGREVGAENDMISVIEKTKVDVQCLNRKLEDMRRELVEMRMGTSLTFSSVVVEQELELEKAIEITRGEVEDRSSC